MARWQAAPSVWVERVTAVGAPWQVNVAVDGGGGTSLTVVTAAVDTLASSAPSAATPVTVSEVVPEGVRLTT